MLSINQVGDTTTETEIEAAPNTETEVHSKAIIGTTVESSNQAVTEEETTTEKDVENNGNNNDDKDDDEVVVPAKKIFVGGIPKQLNDNEFLDHFKSYGLVDDIVLMRYPGNPQNRGFGFVKYKSKKIADHVLSLTHKLGSGGHEVTVNYSKTRDGNAVKDKRFFVGGLPRTLTETAYKAYFETFGAVKDILFRPEKGYGFVEFTAETDEDIKMVRTLASKNHQIDGQDIRVAVAKPRGERSNNGPRPGQNDWGHQNGGRGGYSGYNNQYAGPSYGGGYQGGYQQGGYGYGAPPPQSYPGYSYNNAPPAPSSVSGYAPPSGYGSAPPAHGSSGYSSGGYGAPPTSSSGYGQPQPSSGGYGHPPQQSHQQSYRPY